MNGESQFNPGNVVKDESCMTASRCLAGAVFALVVKQPDDRKLWDQMAAAPENQPLQPPLEPHCYANH